MDTYRNLGQHMMQCSVRFPAKARFITLVFSVLLSLIAGISGRSSAGDNALSFADVVKKAEKMSHQPFQKPESIPDYLRKMSYDQWQKIRFLDNKSPWPGGENFSLQFVHLGYLYEQPVKINIIDAQGVHRFQFSPKLFNYGNTQIGQKVPENLGFAGFNVYFPLKPGGSEEFLSFLGASYFRALGRQQWFGLSARGIAIDTASSNGEQFPYFKEFWLIRPEARADSMKIYALLDGESVTGAYRFVVYPGEQTEMDVKAVVFLRKAVQKLGIAPFSSMFLQGSNSLRQYTTLAPQVHNSDGLSIKTQDDRWIYRPLQNPGRLGVYSFELNNPVGFGLMQRDRRFCSYQSLSLHYQDRPSAWVTATGKWGKGKIQLIEIPTSTRNNDNIVAFWIPDRLPAPNNPIPISYKISWQGERMTLPKVGYVVNTRTGEGGANKNAQVFNIDFAGGKLKTISPNEVSAVVTVDNQAKLLEQHIVKNEFVEGLRLELQIEPAGKPVQLRAYLKKGNEVLTETWDYVFYSP